MSGGEQQRVAIARAIVGDPSVILADEPTAALDGENGQAVMTILVRLAKTQRRGVLVVTHDTRLLPFADRIIHIEDGRVQPEQSSALRGLRLGPRSPRIAHDPGAAGELPNGLIA